ncbi:unnamed protein product [Closterium sp. NIES-64]|nr:unnamed protein product [Closterium sp. NIES-65]CAI5995923.1 unnamed protein product [Closterium sp. NIES-64]
MSLLTSAAQVSQLSQYLLLLSLIFPLAALPLPDATVTSTLRGNPSPLSSFPRYKHAPPGAPPAHSLLQQLRAAPRGVQRPRNADHVSAPARVQTASSVASAAEKQNPSKTPSAEASASASASARSAEPPTPFPPAPRLWPERFHAVLFQNRSGRLALTELWYDWPGGRNMNAIRPQLSAGTLMDVEWSNGTSFYYNLQERSCKVIKFPVGILRPDWLVGAVLVREGEVVDGKFRCRVWTKADFILYYEDMETGFPVKWIFLGSGGIFHVLSFEPGATLLDEQWQAPAMCFH